MAFLLMFDFSSRERKIGAQRLAWLDKDRMYVLLREEIVVDLYLALRTFWELVTVSDFFFVEVNRIADMLSMKQSGKSMNN